MKRTKPVLILFLAYVAGCSSTPPEDRYYSLVLDAADDGVAKVNGDARMRVSLSRIDIPEFLESRAMALQTGGNEIQVAQHHFWAERLDEAIAKVLVRDITEAAKSVDIARGNQNSYCELRVEFDRFHATGNARVLVSGRYWLSSEEGSERGEFDLSQGLTSSGYASAVSTLRNSLVILAREIGGEIESGTVCQEPEPAA